MQAETEDDRDCRWMRICEEHKSLAEDLDWMWNDDDVSLETLDEIINLGARPACNGRTWRKIDFGPGRKLGVTEW